MHGYLLMVNVGLQVILEVVDLFGHGEVVDLGHFVFFKILSDIHLRLAHL